MSAATNLPQRKGTQMQSRNYQRELDEIIANINGAPPRLLLHACCAPCSSYCLEYLTRFFEITLLYYNPNITDHEEYQKRAAELVRLAAEMPLENPVRPVIGEFDAQTFYSAVKGSESAAEGGERCFKCYRLRLNYAAKYASEHGFEYFCTTLSISPLKNAQKLNTIGEELSKIYKVQWLPGDFKKRGGYQRSIELSKQYGLYRQNYCGCEYSKNLST